MSQPEDFVKPARPKMTLKLNTGNKINTLAGVGSSSATPTPGGFNSSTPVATPGGSMKIKFKPRSAAATPAPNPATEVPTPRAKKTKTGRTTKPSAKIREGQKRANDDSDTDGEGATIQVKTSRPPTKKIKIAFGKSPAPAITPKTPVALKVKYKSKTVKREPGVGYDSEASDRELDPAIEEQIILRMVPGDDCDYLRDAIANRKIGLKKSEGGPDIHMRFYDPAGRRGAITIRGVSYAATVVDLPCIIEGMKSWDRRNYLKSADICQMMLVFARIDKEDDAKTIELPREIDPKTFQYPHGLTAPLRNARKRRFRKRVAQHTIEAVEEAVEALLKADAEAESSTWDVQEQEEGSRRATSAFTEDSYGEQYDEGEEDAEGEEDTGYFGAMHHDNGDAQPMEEDLEADLEAELEAEMQQDAIAETPMSTTGATPMTGSEFVQVKKEDDDEEELDSEDESVEEDDDVDDPTRERGERAVDENERARQAQTQALREDIADLEKQIATNETSLALQQNPILKKRLGDNIKKSKTDLDGKKSELAQLLGEDDD